MHVIWGALRIGDEPAARAALARRSQATGADDDYGRFLRIAVDGRFDAWYARPLLAIKLWLAGDKFLAGAAELVRLGVELDVPREQLVIGRLLAAPGPGATNQRRANGYAAQASALLLLGRPEAALRQLDSGAVFAPVNGGYALQPAEWRVLLPLAGMPMPEREREAGRQVLSRVVPADPRWPRATFALLLDAAARRDTAARERWHAALAARARTDSVAAHLAGFAEALLLGQDGRIDSALSLSSAIRRDPGRELSFARGPLLRAVVYLARGEWQSARRQPELTEREWLWHENNDLRSWPTGEPQEGELDAALSALVRLRRAENLLTLGRQSEACALYRRAGELWQAAEPSFDSLRDVARRGLTRCGG
jgi:tetratricopeptide (TPR) repeat protein